MGYITNFIVYTLAMVGVIVVALLIFKNATSFGNAKNSKYLKIIDSISLGQRKNLFIVSTGKEQFLLAGDVNNTSLISKLEGLNCISSSVNEQKINVFNEIKPTISSFQETLNSLPKQSYMDKSNIRAFSDNAGKKSSNSVMKNIAEIIRNK